MTEYERLSLIALAEIMDLLRALAYPSLAQLGTRSREVSDALRAAADVSEASPEVTEALDIAAGRR